MNVQRHTSSSAGTFSKVVSPRRNKSNTSRYQQQLEEHLLPSRCGDLFYDYNKNGSRRGFLQHPLIPVQAQEKQEGIAFNNNSSSMKKKKESSVFEHTTSESWLRDLIPDDHYRQHSEAVTATVAVTATPTATSSRTTSKATTFPPESSSKLMHFFVDDDDEEDNNRATTTSPGDNGTWDGLMTLTSPPANSSSCNMSFGSAPSQTQLSTEIADILKDLDDVASFLLAAASSSGSETSSGNEEGGDINMSGLLFGKNNNKDTAAATATAATTNQHTHSPPPVSTIYVLRDLFADEEDCTAETLCSDLEMELLQDDGCGGELECSPTPIPCCGGSGGKQQDDNKNHYDLISLCSLGRELLCMDGNCNKNKKGGERNSNEFPYDERTIMKETTSGSDNHTISINNSSNSDTFSFIGTDYSPVTTHDIDEQLSLYHV